MCSCTSFVTDSCKVLPCSRHMRVTWTAIWWSEYCDTGAIRVNVFTDADACDMDGNLVVRVL